MHPPPHCHTGANSVYSWDPNGDGTGTTFVNVTDRAKDLSWATKGAKNLTVTTANAVSSKTNVTVVIVQEEVTGLVVTQTTAPAGEAHIVQVSGQVMREMGGAILRRPAGEVHICQVSGQVMINMGGAILW
ncbi:hypothetical protein ACOMHN_041385 [Nucella lapillus]